ncbi:MAG: hypothetical protein D6749_08480 [Chloroflexota bacterium]|nr:MAG: hypothetical protein D6749_08480 [Chloroflexota bacterium]
MRPFAAFSALLCLLCLLFPVPSAAQEEGLAIITSPAPAQTLIGVVNVQGTAASPNFQRYRLEYAVQGSLEPEWFSIVEIAQQVTNGTLALWDTTALPDGVYQLRLRVFLRSGAVLQTVVQGLNVINRSPTALPTLPQPATARATELPTLGPSPTPLIQQPPTSPPRPTIASLGLTPQPPSEGQRVASQAALVLQALQGAFCNGALFTLFAFALFGVYRLFQVRLRPRLRRWLSDGER